MNLLSKNSLLLANLSLFLLSFSLSSFPFVASASLGIFCFFNVLYGFSKRREIQRGNFWISLPVWGILLTYIACLTYSPNVDYGMKYISRSLVFILIPFVLWYRGGINNITYLKTTKFFIVGITLTCILSLIISSLNFLESQNIEAFTYYQLAETIHLHPTYFSLFILSALIFLHQHKKERIRIKLFIIVVLIITLILLQSRVALIGLALVLIYSFIASKSKTYKTSLIIFSVLIVTIGYFSTDLKNRFNEIVTFDPNIEALGTFSENGINQRAWLWNNALRQIEKQPAIGYGLGAQRNLFQWQVERMLLEAEFNSEMNIAAKKFSENNLHNQYLQIAYECGYLGLLLFIGMLFILCYFLLKRKKYQELLIVLLVSIFLLTENLIARQMGIYFYGFMFSIFLSTSEETT